MRKKALTRIPWHHTVLPKPPLSVMLEVYLLLSLVLTCVLTNREYEGDESGTPDIAVEPSGGVVGLIQ